MAAKRGTKRKDNATASSASTNGASNALASPDRATWPGWVEMESEPAFFNVMLREMGVQGVRVQEVYSLDDDMLAILPQPVHALIFLFRYRETDGHQPQAGSCPEHVWFANQTPEFACASFALLNIVNNIPGLDLGDELRNFKDFTKDMDPLSRGDAVDSFEFVKRIHNSFARENDLLQADMHLKNKASRLKKRQALAKARETREAKKAASTPPNERQNASTENTPSRASARTKTPAKKAAFNGAAPKSGADSDFKPTKQITKEDAPQQANVGVRRSGRQPKPRTTQNSAAAASTIAAEDDGFHFCAYMPIQGHVWKLDGMDRSPQDVGSFEDGADWMHIAQPALMGRMAQYENADIHFTLMAIVHDPLASDRSALLENIKTLKTIDKKLDSVYEDWRSFDGAETKREVITAMSSELNITLADIEAAKVPVAMFKRVEQEDDLLKLIELRCETISQQAGLRAMVRDAIDSAKRDDEQARHRRHDYGSFVRSWLGALGGQDLLDDLVAAA